MLSEFNFTGSGSIGIFDLLCYSNNNIDVFLMVGHDVICTGNEISKNTRPTKAGLNGLLPKPPNDILPIPMATNAPIIIMNIGKLLGMLNANSIPVIMAEPSQMVVSCFKRNL